MRTLQLSPLILAALSLLATLAGSKAECCTTMAHLEFTITNGHCGVVNAKRTEHGCSVTVCGDGTPVEGLFCGRGPCNSVGCNCMGGCRHGNYGKTFVSRNQGLGIILMNSEIVNNGPGASVWGAVWDGITNQIRKF
ncbi:hypothetical protein KR038_004606 [Drosophila bunnanda]|nr:hypothetical protein KR038_004606 [Drosophila bunnanda]